MGIYIVLRNQELTPRADDRLVSTYMQGFRLMRALTSRKILQNIHFGQALFNGFSTFNGEVRIDNRYGWFDETMSPDVDGLTSGLDGVRRNSDARYPYLDTNTIQTTLLWSGDIDGVPCAGHMKFREPRADGSSKLGHVEIDLNACGTPDTSEYDEETVLAEHIRLRTTAGKLSKEGLNRLIELVLEESGESRYESYRVPEYVCISSDDYPLSMFHRAIALGVRSVRQIPPLMYDMLSAITAEPSLVMEGVGRPWSKVQVPEMYRAVETLSRTYLNAVLSGPRMEEKIVSGCLKAGITVTKGSLVVSTTESLTDFLRVVLETYESVLESIYDDVSRLRKKLDDMIRPDGVVLSHRRKGWSRPR